MKILKNFNIRFNRRFYNGLALLISIIPTVWVYLYARGDMEWWGKIGQGYWGFTAYCLISLMIWYQLLQHNLKGIVLISLMRTIWGGGEVELRPNFFHNDNFHGFACVEKIIVLGYITTLIHIASIYIALHFGYITRDLNIILLGVIGTFVVFVPIFIVFPFYKISSSIKQYRDKEIIMVKKVIADTHMTIRTKLNLKQTAEVSPQELQTLMAFLSLHNTLKDLKIMPLSKNKILGMMVLYAFQICAVVVKLLGLIKTQ